MYCYGLWLKFIVVVKWYSLILMIYVRFGVTINIKDYSFVAVLIFNFTFNWFSSVNFQV
jgi:hypothetical protein